MASASPRRIAYLVGYHPAVSHTFIDREIAALAARGVEVAVCSLRHAPADQMPAEGPRPEPAAYVVQPPGAGRVLRATLRAMLTPARLARTVRQALRSSSPGVRSRVWHLFYAAEAVLLRDELARRGVRHVHAHFANSASTVAMLTAELGGPRTTWSFTMHGPTEFDDVRGFALADKVREAAFVACIGDYCRSQLLKLVEPEHWERLTVVRCGLEPGPAPERPAAVADAPLRVLCVGRLVPEKGQRLLLEAVASLRGEGVDTRLELVGDGPDRATLEARAVELGLAEHAVFHGSLAPAAVATIYERADVFCLPSFAEGIPVVLMEAMAAELPVLTTRITGVPELVTDGETGILVEPGRVESLTAALRRLTEDASLRARLGAAAREDVCSRFDVRDSAARLERAFVAAGEGRPPPAA